MLNQPHPVVPTRLFNVDALCDRSPATVCIVGGSGSGKSTIAARLARLLHARRVRVVSNNCNVFVFYKSYLKDAVVDDPPHDCVIVDDFFEGPTRRDWTQAASKYVIRVVYKYDMLNRLPRRCHLCIVTGNFRWQVFPFVNLDCPVWHSPCPKISRAHLFQSPPAIHTWMQQWKALYGGNFNTVCLPVHWSRLDLDAQFAAQRAYRAWMARVRVVMEQARILYASAAASFVLHPETVGCKVWRET